MGASLIEAYGIQTRQDVSSTTPAVCLPGTDRMLVGERVGYHDLRPVAAKQSLDENYGIRTSLVITGPS